MVSRSVCEGIWGPAAGCLGSRGQFEILRKDATAWAVRPLPDTKNVTLLQGVSLEVETMLVDGSEIAVAGRSSGRVGIAWKVTLISDQ